jgi:hypothetical protein
MMTNQIGTEVSNWMSGSSNDFGAPGNQNNQVLLSDSTTDYSSTTEYVAHPLTRMLTDEDVRSARNISFNNKGIKFGDNGPLLGDRVTWDPNDKLAEPNFEYGSQEFLQKDSPGPDAFIRGGWRTSLDRRLIDFKRISKFYATPAGRQFLMKEFILQKHNPRKPKFYNFGINTLQQVALAGIQNVKRGGLLSIGGFGQVGEFLVPVDYIGDIGKKNWRENNYNLGDPGRKSTQEGLAGLAGSLNPFNRNKPLPYNVKLKGKTDLVNAIPILKNSILKNNQFEKKSKDFVKFRFEVVDHDKGENNLIIFRAFLDSIGDDYTANHNSFKYNGRGEPFYVYKQFNRKMSVGFKVAAQTRHEMKPIYQKLNYLAAQTAPNYSPMGRIRTPYCYLTVGDWFNRVPGLITSVSLKWQKDYVWEIALDRKPKKVDQASDTSDEPEDRTKVGQFIHDTGEKIKNSQLGEAVIKKANSIKDGMNSSKDKDMLVLPHVLDVTVNFQPIHAFNPTNDPTTPFIGINGGSSGGPDWTTDENNGGIVYDHIPGEESLLEEGKNIFKKINEFFKGKGGDDSGGEAPTQDAMGDDIVEMGSPDIASDPFN